MGKSTRPTTKTEKRGSFGAHGGNRSGHRAASARKPNRSSQAAGKNPQRGGKVR